MKQVIIDGVRYVPEKEVLKVEAVQHDYPDDWDGREVKVRFNRRPPRHIITALLELKYE